MLVSGRDNSKILTSYLLVSSPFCNHFAPGHRIALSQRFIVGRLPADRPRRARLLGFLLRRGKRHRSGQESFILAALSLVTDILPAPITGWLKKEINFLGLGEKKWGLIVFLAALLCMFLGVPVFIAEVLA